MPSTIEAIFAFEFSLEAANKNFILLNRKFGGDFSKALLAQSNSPLGYGSEFKPTKTLELIFKNHPSWSRMKRILTHGSKWPLQPLDEELPPTSPPLPQPLLHRRRCRHCLLRIVFAAADVPMLTTMLPLPLPLTSYIIRIQNNILLFYNISPLPYHHRRCPTAAAAAAITAAPDVLHNTNIK